MKKTYDMINNIPESIKDTRNFQDKLDKALAHSKAKGIDIIEIGFVEYEHLYKMLVKGNVKYATIYLESIDRMFVMIGRSIDYIHDLEKC